MENVTEGRMHWTVNWHQFTVSHIMYGIREVRIDAIEIHADH